MLGDAKWDISLDDAIHLNKICAVLNTIYTKHLL